MAGGSIELSGLTKRFGEIAVAKLRRSLKIELKALQERVGITFLYVTHDQEEALTMSDRLAVMNAGKIAQIGTPRQVYEEPTWPTSWARPT